MNNYIQTINMLDELGCYRLADIYQSQLTKTAAFPYNLSALDELPLPARQVTWKRNEEDYEQFDDVFWNEFKSRLPDYYNLNTDDDEKLNFEGELHGDDPTPGPGYIMPDEMATSPSMNGDLNDFTWENTHDVNQGTEGWKNLLPRR